MKEIDLESQLKIKKNEYKMLNDSFIDLIDKNGNQTSINELKKAIESTMDDIYNISANIQAHQIKRHIMERAVATKEEIERIDFYNKIKKIPSMENEINNELESSSLLGKEGSFIRANRFLMRFDGIEIPSYTIESAFFDAFNKRIGITCRNVVVNGKPLTKIIEEIFNLNGEEKFTTMIDYLAPNGNILYTEKYTNCAIANFYRGQLSYKADDILTITLGVSYEDIKYTNL